MPVAGAIGAVFAANGLVARAAAVNVDECVCPPRTGCALQGCPANKCQYGQRVSASGAVRTRLLTITKPK